MVTKSFITAAMLLLIAGAAIAADGPLDKGSWMLDGQFFFRMQSGDLWESGDGDATTVIGIGNGSLNAIGGLEIAPAFAYCISPGLFIGAQLSYLGFFLGDNKLYAVAIGPSLTYYLGANKVRTEYKGAALPYFGAFFTYGSLNDEDDKIADIMQIGGRAGLTYMLSESVGADFGARFQSDRWKSNRGDPIADETVSGTTFQFGVGISAFIY